MILIRYSKTDGAEFIPHLDMLKHLAKIIRRTKINVNYSLGFNPHMLIFMSAPIALGLKSQSEYCLIDTTETAATVKERFNDCSPKGIRLIDAIDVDKKINVASDIVSSSYEIYGLNYFDVNEVLNADSFVVTDKKSNQKEVKDKILSLRFDGEVLIANLKFGNDTLRPDYLAEKLKSLYGGENIDIIKKDVKFKEGLNVKI